MIGRVRAKLSPGSVDEKELNTRQFPRVFEYNDVDRDSQGEVTLRDDWKKFTVQHDLVVEHDLDVSNDLDVDNDLNVGNNLTVDNDLTVSGNYPGKTPVMPNHYERDAVWQAKGNGTAAERYTIQSPSYMTVNINNNGYLLSSQQELDLSESESWDDITGTDWTTASNRAGKDFYIYACEPSSGITPDLILSASSTYPDGYTADNSRKIGGFHCLCEDVGTITGHDLSDYVQGDILPASVWDLNHRPISDPEGMVWDEKSNLWWDIYLASWSSGLQSVYDATIVDGGSDPELHWYNFAEEFAEVKKRLPFQHEFMSAALGSPQETNISGSADPGTTGGHEDTAGRRIISNIGCEDMTGVLWQWGADGGATNDVGSSWSVADTDGTADSLDDDESIGRGQHYEAPNRPRFGGAWYSGAKCGSRGSSWDYSPLALNASYGARGVAEPKC